MDLRDTYIADAEGNVEHAAGALAHDLMRDDPATFKRGYSEDNAVIAAAEFFGIEREAVRIALSSLQEAGN